MSTWRRLGRVFSPSPGADWEVSHASVPFAVKTDAGRFRVYFSTRDSGNRSHTSSFELDLNEISVASESREFHFGPGPLGHFDDCGVTMSCGLEGENRFYYMGWSLPKTVPFSNEIGMAHLRSDGSFERDSNRPVLGKCEQEPLSFGYPWVMKSKGLYYMWYDTILEWRDNSTDNYEFVLRAATSKDGATWEKAYDVEFPFSKGERAIARPCILRENSKFKMWASIDLMGSYSICYAESDDGFTWERKQFRWLESTPPDDWDSDEQAYPFVFCEGKDRYMLYNGNNYGKSGIGLAVEENPTQIR